MIISFYCGCQKLHHHNTAMIDPEANTINVSSVHQMKIKLIFLECLILTLQYDKSSEAPASTQKSNAIIFNLSQPSNKHHIATGTHHKINCGKQFRFYIGTPCHIFVNNHLTFICVYLHILINKQWKFSN